MAASDSPMFSLSSQYNHDHKILIGQLIIVSMIPLQKMA